jgi:hypothetical protein
MQVLLVIYKQLLIFALFLTSKAVENLRHPRKSA